MDDYVGRQLSIVYLQVWVPTTTTLFNSIFFNRGGIAVTPHENNDTKPLTLSLRSFFLILISRSLILN